MGKVGVKLEWRLGIQNIWHFCPKNKVDGLDYQSDDFHPVVMASKSEEGFMYSRWSLSVDWYGPVPTLEMAKDLALLLEKPG